MALSKRAKVGVAIVALAVVGGGVALAAASGGRKARQLPAPVEDDGLEDDELEDDDAEDEPDDSPSIVTPGPGHPSVPGSGPPDETAFPMPIEVPPIVVQPPPMDMPQPPIVLPELPGIVPQPITSPPPFVPPPYGSQPFPIPDAPPVIVQPPAGPPIKVPAPPAGMPVILQPVDEAAADMIAELLAAERTSGWKRKYDSVMEWQGLTGRKVDGMFGPGDALALAMHAGTIPIIRYWPASSGTNPKAALEDYRAGLMTIAATKSQSHAAELQAAARREKGQSFGPPFGTGGKGPVV